MGGPLKSVDKLLQNNNRILKYNKKKKIHSIMKNSSSMDESSIEMEDQEKTVRFID